MDLFSSHLPPHQPPLPPRTLPAEPPFPRNRRKQDRHLHHHVSAYRSDAYNGMVAPSHGLCFDDPLTPPPPYHAYAYRHEHFEMPSSKTTKSRQDQLYGPHPLHPCVEPAADVQRGHRLWKKASAWTSTRDLSKRAREDPHAPQPQQEWQGSVPLHEPRRYNDCPIVGSMIQSAALCDRVAAHVQAALGSIDQEEEEDRMLDESTRALSIEDQKTESKTKDSSIIDFKKTWLYANSRLPRHMPPMKIYIATWQIICAAAKASMDIYRRPKKDEREDYVAADWRHGTKAMAIKSRPVDDKNLIVIAVRGSKWNLMDWAVNFRPAPSEPIGLIDDEGNACHAGFLQVARAMIAPIAARLRNLLEQNPGRASSSLLFTGHSAGGAVASLLYMHMMATSFESELNILTGCFKRVHCVSFGTPPLSFLPLQTPRGRRYERNVFMAFANEGDPVVRADRQYLSTLTRIIAAPSPLSRPSAPHGLRQKASRYALKSSKDPGDKTMPVRWDIPPATLSNAGRLVVLREKPGCRNATEAVLVSDEELRDVVFGDPEMHHMELYKRRVDELAIAAITGRGLGRDSVF